MPTGFLRYFENDPGDDVLLAIESANVIDTEPPAPTNGVGTGCACCVGEFEDGAFNSPIELSSASDLLAALGGFGFNYDGVVANNPCARVRKVDATLLAEYWNGNGAIALNRKKFARLICVRADTSVGTVRFVRLANLVGVAKFTYNLTSGQSITLTAGSTTSTVAMTGVHATVTGADAAFATIVGSETATLGYDAEDDFTVTFLSSDTTVSAAIARINQYAGFAFAVDDGHGQIKLTGIVPGVAGKVRVTSGSTGALAKLGLTVAITPGTGNTQNVNKTTIAELNTAVHLVDTNVIVETMADGRPRMVNLVSPSTLLISAATAADFGFPVGVTNSSASGNAGTIPAGTLVKDAVAGTFFVTMQSIIVTPTAQSGVTASGPGPYMVPVRHATDDGTGVLASAGNVNVISQPISFDAFSVINLAGITAALTEAQIDNAYQDAFDATLDINSVAKEVNIIWSARQSNSVRQTIRDNVKDATANGLTARISCLRPPFGTPKSTALSYSAAPGVGATRDQRVIYNYPAWSVKMNPIAQRGVAGGAGFTADGVVDVGSDGFLASLMSQLPPEENPGQETPFLDAVLGIESSPNCQKLTMADYINFKKAGICAPRMDAGMAFYQSGCTSVDPALHPGLVNISRRRMGDYCQGSCQRISAKFIKKLSKASRRAAHVGELRSFAMGLMGKTNEAERRIAGFTITDKGVSTPQQMARGLHRVKCDFRFLSSMDAIALMSQVGEDVQVEELAPGESQ